MSAARGTSPAFMLYAFDLMVKQDYRLMTLEERGLLLSMWCECWANPEIPADPDDLATMLGKPGEVQKALTPRVLAFFEKTKNGTFTSPDIETYRKKVLDQRERMSAGGTKGGKKRAENEKKAREASSHHSKSNQATLKCREPESKSESENQSTERAIIDKQFVADYEAAESCTSEAYAKASGRT
ncbi:MAG: hypothetical protein WA435_12125 [Gallionellaceae bacterium]